jgi:hypothetical protein
LAGDWEAAGMGGDTTQEAALVEPEIAKKARISLYLNLSLRLLATA